MGGGKEDVGGVVAADFAAVGVGEAGEDGDLVAEGFEAFEALVELEVAALAVREPLPFRLVTSASNANSKLSIGS